MALADKGPKRSVCFASFDTEERMAFGAFAFTLSKAFEGKKIAAVVNIDMLGRDFLDIIENSLFVIGTENYPQLRAEIMQKAQGSNLQILPLSTELTGPAGDHLAFEHLDIPVLFFCCGYNKDYHATTDTPEKLDYETIKKSVDLIADTVGFLADSKVTRLEQPGPDDAQLRTLSRLAQVTGNDAGLTACTFIVINHYDAIIPFQAGTCRTNFDTGRFFTVVTQNRNHDLFGCREFSSLTDQYPVP